jgi:hypothetical protein
MTKLLMTTAALFALVVSALSARAGSTTRSHLGQWCVIPNESNIALPPGYESYLPLSPEGKCERADRLTIKQNELSAIESGCRFAPSRRLMTFGRITLSRRKPIGRWSWKSSPIARAKASHRLLRCG